MIIDINNTCLRCSAFAYACSGCSSNEHCECADPNFLHFDMYASGRLDKCLEYIAKPEDWLSKEEWNKQMSRTFDHLTNSPIFYEEPKSNLQKTVEDELDDLELL